jgi:hypothetical protein
VEKADESQRQTREVRLLSPDQTIREAASLMAEVDGACRLAKTIGWWA